LLTSALIINLLSLGAGAAAGYFFAQTFRPVQRERKEIEDKLVEAQNELNNYQQKVADHFRNTSGAISNLSENYKEVLGHLASGALHLANADVSRQIVNSTFDATEDVSLASNSDLKPPKDYAPKVPGGVLSEEYGLKETTITATTPTEAELDYITENDDDPTLNINQ